MEKTVYIGQYINKEFGIMYGGIIGETIVIHSERINNIGTGSSTVVTTVPLYYPAHKGCHFSITKESYREGKKNLDVIVESVDFYNGSITVKTKVEAVERGIE